MSDAVIKVPVRTIEVGVVEPLGAPPYALVTLAMPIEGAQYLAAFMTDAEAPANWLQLTPVEATTAVVMPSVEADIEGLDADECDAS